MLVRDLGDRWQIVLQPDHGAVAGQLAAAWAGNGALSPALREALVLAATRHDDGWAVWERHPHLDSEGRPQSFLAVPFAALFSSYRASAEVMAAEHPAAGLLVSMHVSGLQRNRYGVMGGEPTALEELRPLPRELVEAEERRQAALARELGLAQAELWRAYELLQIYDTMSLYLGMADLDGGAPRTIGELELAPLTGEPWAVRCAPFPFARDPLEVRMRRRVLAQPRVARRGRVPRRVRGGHGRGGRHPPGPVTFLT